LLVVGFAKPLHVSPGAAFLGQVSARLQALLQQTAVVTRCRELVWVVLALFEEEDDCIPKTIRVGRKPAIVVQSVSLESERCLLDTMLVGMEQVEPHRCDWHECQHRQTDAQSPNDPPFREQFQGFSALWEHHTALGVRDKSSKLGVPLIPGQTRVELCRDNKGEHRAAYSPR
jgi:hypothetical protein